MMAREGMREKTLGDLRGDIVRAGGWIAGGIVIATAIAVVFYLYGGACVPGADDRLARERHGRGGDFGHGRGG